MCDPISVGFGVASMAASIGISAKNAHDQRKASREAQKVQEDTERKQKALLEAKGAAQTSRTDTAATEADRKRRTAVANNTVLTSRQGALGTPNTAGTALYSGIASRNTLG